MEKLKSDKLSISDTLIAVSLLTLAIPLKFMPFHTSVVWLIELPFLIFIGLNFDRKVYRYFCFALAGILFFKVIAMTATNAGGGVGGIFAPSLFMGGVTGFFVARLINFFEPSRLPEKNLRGEKRIESPVRPGKVE